MVRMERKKKKKGIGLALGRCARSGRFASHTIYLVEYRAKHPKQYDISISFFFLGASGFWVFLFHKLEEGSPTEPSLTLTQA